METLRLDGKNVYTQLRNYFSIPELEQAKAESKWIRNAYFFELSGNRDVRKIPYDRIKIQDKNSALMLEVEGYSGVACLTISSLERITSFLSEAGISKSDVAYLNGTPVKSYSLGPCLIGISLDKPY